MNKRNKAVAIIIFLAMIFSIVVMPFSAAYASAPDIKLPVEKPGINIPTIDRPVINNPITKDPSSIRDHLRKLKRAEEAARVKGVTYKLKPGVEKLPSDMSYDLEQIRLDDLVNYEGADKVTGKETIDPNKLKGIRYNPGSKFMVLPKADLSKFTPKANKIYIDEGEGLAYRVLQDGKTDAEGNKQYVVETPALTDIFESYKIPKQDIKLTTGNIAYMAPGVQLDPRSGMSPNYMAADNGFLSGYRHEGNKHILTLTPGKMIFQYPSKEDREKTEEEKKKAEKEKFKGDWWNKEQYSDLRGFEEGSELKVEVKIKEGTITIEDPTFHADFDLNWLTTQAKADFYFESKTIADVTFEGDLKFNKTVETCIFGYDIDLGSVLGKEKGNRAFVGIFLVLGVNGKVHVEVRTIATGNARAGFAYKAIAYGFIPYFVGPYVTYRPTGFDATFAADGELHAVLACVPQVGVIIWGTEIGALQIWLGLKGDAKFSVSGGGGTGTDGAIKSKGSLDLGAFAEMVGYLFGNRYSIFRLDFPIYHGEWDVGTEVSGGGGDLIREVNASFLAKADAFTNIVEGKIAITDKLIPFANREFDLEIYDGFEDIKISLSTYTDSEGNFKFNTGRYNLLPSDRIILTIPKGDVYERDNKKYKVTGSSQKIYPDVPFTDLDFNVDSFNDIITGVVSGQYSGPVDIEVKDWNGFKVTKYRTNAQKGIFTLSVPINESTYNVKAEINFEGSKFPEFYEVVRERNLDALEIIFINEFAPETSNKLSEEKIQIRDDINIPGINTQADWDKIKINQDDKGITENVDDAGNKVVRPIKIIGSITNKAEMGPIQTIGENYVRNSEVSGIPVQPYLGNVKITSLPVVDSMLAILNRRDHSNLTDPLIRQKGWTATVNAQQVTFDGELTSASTFEFVNPEALCYVLEIEHEGLKKEVRYDPFVFHYTNTLQKVQEFAKQPLQKEVILKTEEKKDAITNPVDSLQNKWKGSWLTNIGTMQLNQEGNFISGTIIQNGKEYAIEGSISNGVFKGSILIPSESSIFGDITSFEMNMSGDGSISFKNFGTNTKLKGLNGTKALKQ